MIYNLQKRLMKKISKYIKYLFSMAIIVFFWFWFFSNCLWVGNSSTDLLDQVFDEAMDNYSVLEVWWRDKKKVWIAVLKGDDTMTAWDSLSSTCFDKNTKEILYMYSSWQKLKIGNERDCYVAWWQWWREAFEMEHKTPIIVKIIKVLLRITIVLSITMTILAGVKLMISVFSGKDIKSSDAKKDLIGIIVWLLLAMFSITIINLIRSIPNSSLKTSNDISYQMNSDFLV